MMPSSQNQEPFNMNGEKIQEGIYWQEKSKPGKHFAILFIKIEKDAVLSSTYEELQGLWKILTDLKKGKVGELDDFELPNCNLKTTIGYGQNVFLITGAKKEKTEPLITYGLLRTPLPTGGGDVLKGSGLKYSADTIKNFATEDLCIQFVADTPLGVNRGVVETWKYLQSTKNIMFVRFYDGFQREDSRSWIGFHDGISNLKSGTERLDAIEIKPTIQKDEWTIGGTYLYFLRIKVDLGIWNALPKAEQELLVGRNKITGCPFITMTGKKPVPITGCPVMATEDISEVDENGNIVNIDFFNTPSVSNEILKASHIQRANHHILPVSDRNSLRIFRQGYEFLESQSNAPGLNLGLNFVSFQDTPERVNRILTQSTWLGKVNFGGLENEQTNGIDKVLSVISGGIYLIPPDNSLGKLPGYEIFEDETII